MGTAESVSAKPPVPKRKEGHANRRPYGSPVGAGTAEHASTTAGCPWLGRCCIAGSGPVYCGGLTALLSRRQRIGLASGAHVRKGRSAIGNAQVRVGRRCDCCRRIREATCRVGHGAVTKRSRVGCAEAPDICEEGVGNTNRRSSVEPRPCADRCASGCHAGGRDGHCGAAGAHRPG